MHLFTPSFELSTVFLLAAKTDFSLSHKKIQKNLLKKNKGHVSFFEQQNHVLEMIILDP